MPDQPEPTLSRGFRESVMRTLEQSLWRNVEVSVSHTNHPNLHVSLRHKGGLVSTTVPTCIAQHEPAIAADCLVEMLDAHEKLLQLNSEEQERG